MNGPRVTGACQHPRPEQPTERGLPRKRGRHRRNLPRSETGPRTSSPTVAEARSETRAAGRPCRRGPRARCHRGRPSGRQSPSSRPCTQCTPPPPSTTSRCLTPHACEARPSSNACRRLQPRRETCTSRDNWKIDWFFTDEVR
jgi:hypothetical protein